MRAVRASAATAQAERARAEAPPGTSGEPELAAVRPVAAGGIEIEPGAAQPTDGQILERMAGSEDAQ